MSDRQSAMELLANTHRFPGPVMVKVIGRAGDAFISEVLAAAREQLLQPWLEIESRRESAGGRHVALTLEPVFDTPEEVLDLYDRLRQIDGVVLLL